MCVFEYGFWLRPTVPGRGSLSVCFCLAFACSPPILAGVLGCVCLCAGSASTPPFLAGVCRACVRARLLTLPRPLVWVCVCGFGFMLHPAIPGSGVGLCVCVRAMPVPRHSWLGCSVWVCVLGFGFRLPRAIPGWDVGVCVFGCALGLNTPLPAGVRGVCVSVRFFRFHPVKPG